MDVGEVPLLRLLLLLGCRAAFVGAVGYTFVGNGQCEDASGAEFERWFMPGFKASELIYTTDLATCQCPECVAVCDDYAFCVGYQFYCCPFGEACSGGASVLFARGTRPLGEPPGKFQLLGPSDSQTAGQAFNGSGAITGVPEGGSTREACYRKLGVAEELPPATGTITGYIYEPHTMSGTSKTLEATWKSCQLRCQMTPSCEHWGYWPDHGCHLQGSGAQLVQASCQGDSSCIGANVISGPRSFDNASDFPTVPPGPGRGSGSGVASTITPGELGPRGYRGMFFMALLFTLAGTALYVSAVRRWSRKRWLRKRRRQLEAQRAAAAAGNGDPAALEQPAREVVFCKEEEDDEEEDEEEEEESDEEAFPLSQRKPLKR